MTAQQQIPMQLMSQAELEARAHGRAYDQRVHIFSVPGRPGIYTTRSKSEPNRRYSLVAKDGVIACNCKAFEHRKTCKHSAALLNRLAREGALCAELLPAEMAPGAR
ncbi:MAG: SWIM zinc finger family protein [Dehalococcoidia bacterium]